MKSKLLNNESTKTRRKRRWPWRMLSITVAVLIAAAISRLVFHRGPSDAELRAHVLSTTQGSTGMAIVRNDMDDTGEIWVRVQMSDGSSKEWGYELCELWVWPWQSYFDVRR